jgi:hypothetical protein
VTPVVVDVVTFSTGSSLTLNFLRLLEVCTCAPGVIAPETGVVSGAKRSLNRLFWVISGLWGSSFTIEEPRFELRLLWLLLIGIHG